VKELIESTKKVFKFFFKKNDQEVNFNGKAKGTSILRSQRGNIAAGFSSVVKDMCYCS